MGSTARGPSRLNPLSISLLCQSKEKSGEFSSVSLKLCSWTISKRRSICLSLRRSKSQRDHRPICNSLESSLRHLLSYSRRTPAERSLAGNGPVQDICGDLGREQSVVYAPAGSGLDLSGGISDHDYSGSRRPGQRSEGDTSIDYPRLRGVYPALSGQAD